MWLWNEIHFNLLSLFIHVDKIIIGSFNGILRVFKIILNNDAIKNEQNLFQISDLLLEVDFKNPILQIASGYLLNSANVQLAILHPNKLCVYSISCKFLFSVFQFN